MRHLTHMTDDWWTEASGVIRQFQDQVLSSGPEMGRLERLAAMLDDLAKLYRSIPDTEPDDDKELPEMDYVALYKAIGEQYPELGYYWCTDPLPPTQDPELPGLADAIDDLADIYRDLAYAVWLAENVGLDDAAWEFRFGYQIHWGRHLHQLRCHIHWKLYD